MQCICCSFCSARLFPFKRGVVFIHFFNLLLHVLFFITFADYVVVFLYRSAVAASRPRHVSVGSGSVPRVGGDAVFKHYSHIAMGVAFVLVGFVGQRHFAGRRLAPCTAFRVTSVATNRKKQQQKRGRLGRSILFFATTKKRPPWSVDTVFRVDYLRFFYAMFA